MEGKFVVRSATKRRKKRFGLEGFDLLQKPIRLEVRMAECINLHCIASSVCEIPLPANNLRPNLVGYGTVEIGPDFGFYCPAGAAVYVTLPRLR